MKSVRTILVAAATAVFALGASVAVAQDLGAELSVMGGVQALNKNDTAIADHFVNIPVAATLTYHLTPVFAAEGDFTWIIPVKQSVDLDSGESVDAKTPDVLAYQANLRVSLPMQRTAWRPYVIAGAGAVTFLSNTDANRLPQIDKSETAFAINFGGGTTVGLSGPLALRADFREFAASPKNDAAGLSLDGTADPVWMERGTIGLAYRF